MVGKACFKESAPRWSARMLKNGSPLMASPSASQPSLVGKHRLNFLLSAGIEDMRLKPQSLRSLQ